MFSPGESSSDSWHGGKHLYLLSHLTSSEMDVLDGSVLFRYETIGLSGSRIH